MKPSIADQLQFLQRTQNPNYIIILKNKAGEDMDFTKFRTNQLEEKKEKKKVEKRYKIKVLQLEESKVNILVEDTWFSNRIVFDCKCSESKKDERLESVTKQYRGDMQETI